MPDEEVDWSKVPLTRDVVSAELAATGAEVGSVEEEEEGEGGVQER